MKIKIILDGKEYVAKIDTETTDKEFAKSFYDRVNDIEKSWYELETGERLILTESAAKRAAYLFSD